MNAPIKNFYKNIQDEKPELWKNIPIPLSDSVKNTTKCIMDIKELQNTAVSVLQEIVGLIQA